MNPAGAVELARRGHLYPAVILHGGDDAARRSAALEIARTLLCEAALDARPCGVCRHCRRIAWPGGDEAVFHPDFRVVERDLKTVTSVDAVRELLRVAQMSPFEARGQVFAVASAETLSAEAADALLKTLEEPGVRAPRNHLLLAPSQFDLSPTLRSRSLAVYLGPAAPLADAEVAPLAADLAACCASWAERGAPVYLLAAAEALSAAGAGPGGWSDPRAGRPWALAASVAARAARDAELPARLRRPLLELAAALLDAAPLRLRGIPADRILEGLVCRHLTPGAPPG